MSMRKKTIRKWPVVLFALFSGKAAVGENKADVLRQDIVPALNPGGGLAQRGQRQRGAGACTLDDPAVVAGDVAQAHDVVPWMIRPSLRVMSQRRTI